MIWVGGRRVEWVPVLESEPELLEVECETKNECGEIKQVNPMIVYEWMEEMGMKRSGLCSGESRKKSEEETVSWTMIFQGNRG